MGNFTVKVTAPDGDYPFTKARLSLTKGNASRSADLEFTAGHRERQNTFVLDNGDWTIKVTGAGFVPFNQQKAVIGDDNLDIDLTVTWFSLHTDRNRDGNPDDAVPVKTMQPVPVSFGPAGVGAIIPVNCNRDGNNAKDGYTDSQDARVNGDQDLQTGTARIELRRTSFGPVQAIPNDWKVELSLKGLHGDRDAQENIRIFAGDTNASTTLIGPGTTARKAISTHLIANNKTLAVEAVYFAGRGFETGQVTLSMDISQPEVSGPRSCYWFSERIAASRWIMNHHLQTTQNIYVSINPDNDQFRADLDTAAQASNPQSQLVAGDVDGSAEVVPKGGVGVNSNYDLWMRDTVVSGYSSWPGNGNDGVRHQNVFMKTLRQRPLQNWVYRALLNRDNAVYYPAAGGGGAVRSANSGGNIEVTPPVKKTNPGANDLLYPYGRIYFGSKKFHRLDPDTATFLRRQVLQDPIQLDTDWLVVGHVDEMMTFIPIGNPGNPYKRWKLLVASPVAAYQLMDDEAALHGTAKLMSRPAWDNVSHVYRYTDLKLYDTNVRATINVAATINDFCGNGNAPLPRPRGGTYTYSQLKKWNIEGVEPAITANVDKLKAAFDLIDDDIIKVPVIFVPEKFTDNRVAVNSDYIDPTDNDPHNGFNVKPGKSGGFQCGALTADMVNMFVGNQRLMIPRPFGPWIVPDPVVGHDPIDDGYDLFARDIREKIAAANNHLTCDFIDDWSTYHDRSGEIHCGTNETREALNGAIEFGHARFANWWTAVAQ